MSRLAHPQLSFADLELRNQGVHLDPLLPGILNFLDDHAMPVEQVHQDLVRGLKNPTQAATGLPLRRPLRSLILMRVKNWHYRELRERINDGRTLRAISPGERLLDTSVKSHTWRLQKLIEADIAITVSRFIRTVKDPFNFRKEPQILSFTVPILSAIRAYSRHLLGIVDAIPP